MSETVAYRRERIDRGVKVRSDTIYAVSSWREMAYLLLPRVLPVVIVLVLPLFLQGYWQGLVFHITMFGLVALACNLLYSLGLVCLGMAFYFGIGSYISGALAFYLHWPPYFAIPVAMLTGACVSTLLTAPALRLRGIYFAMLTLALPLLGQRLIEASGIFGGVEGLPEVIKFPHPLIPIYLCIFAFLAALFGFRRLINEDYGLILLGIRDNDLAMLSSGINIYWYKTQAVFIASAVAGLAGSLATHYWGYVGMSSFSLDYSLLPLSIVIVGGAGTFTGSALGAFILVPLSEALRALGGLRIIFYCVLLVIFILVVPEGISHFLERKYHQFERLKKV